MDENFSIEDEMPEDWWEAMGTFAYQDVLDHIQDYPDIWLEELAEKIKEELESRYRETRGD